MAFDANTWEDRISDVYVWRQYGDKLHGSSFTPSWSTSQWSYPSSSGGKGLDCFLFLHSLHLTVESCRRFLHRWGCPTLRFKNKGQIKNICHVLITHTHILAIVWSSSINTSWWTVHLRIAVVREEQVLVPGSPSLLLLGRGVSSPSVWQPHSPKVSQGLQELA